MPDLSVARLDAILDRLPSLTVGVVGDLFLDRYFDIDAARTEPSLETGLDAYQVARVRGYPGAAGTVVNNLAALGVGRIVPIAMIGDDGEGYELMQQLAAIPAVDATHVFRCDFADFRTPTYTKPMLCVPGQPPRELNRLDIKNQSPLREMDAYILPALEATWSGLDALVVVDQVSEIDCGVVTRAVRQLVEVLAKREPAQFVLADSRARLGAFRHVTVKPNERECRQLAGEEGSLADAVQRLAVRNGRPVICTLGDRGMLFADPASGAPQQLPAVAVEGPIDTVGAGDSVSAALACARAAGAALLEAAALANLVASITIQQIGVTGTATPAQVRRRAAGFMRIDPC